MKARGRACASRPALRRAVTRAREKNSLDPARKHLSITSVVQGCFGLVSRWSMSFWAQGYSNACAQTGSPMSSAPLMSGAAELVFPGVVGCRAMDRVIRETGDWLRSPASQGFADLCWGLSRFGFRIEPMSTRPKTPHGSPGTTPNSRRSARKRRAAFPVVDGRNRRIALRHYLARRRGRFGNRLRSWPQYME
jgi:hypothetical protein